MDMQEKINEVAIKWADEYDSRDPLQIDKLSDAIIAALREQEPVSYRYKFLSPMDGKTPVWRDSPDTWNGQYPQDSCPLYALPVPPEGICPHRIADVRNPVIQFGYMCLDCGKLFSAADHENPIPPVEQADEIHKLRQGLRRIAEMIDRDGKAIEMHLQVHLKELFGIARAALSEQQQPGEKS